MQDYFLQLKSNLELDPSFADSITTRHTAIRTYLENNHPDFKDSKLIGSLQRQTRIHPGAGHKFDIDIIVIMGEFSYWAASGEGVLPQAALNSLHGTLQNSGRYNSMTPVQDPPTITLTHGDDVEVQLVPAYVDLIGRDRSGKELGNLGRGYWVVKNGAWEMADYDHEAKYISDQNKISGGYLIPTIKMLKAIKRLYFPELDSFPLEVIAADIISLAVIARQFSNQPVYYDDLIREFFLEAPGRLTAAINVPGSKSSAIILDNYVAAELIRKFGILARFITTIDGMSSRMEKIKAWRELVGERFPVAVAGR